MTREIPLTNCNQVALVDDEDYERVNQYKWHGRHNFNSWYAARTINHRDKIFMHRLILNLKENEFCDHINGNGLDNRRCNLRIATTQQNNMNKRKQNGVYSSRFKGVSWSKWANKWTSCIMINNKQIHLKRFYNEEEAARAYDKAARELFGEYARLNFPEELK